MSDILSAASLLLTVLAILFGLWYEEIKSALNLPIERDPRDRGKTNTKIRSTLIARAIPLTIAACLLTLVFAPDTIRIIVSSVGNFSAKGLDAFSDYSAVATSFVLVILITLVLAIYLLDWTIKLIRRVANGLRSD